MDPQQNNDKKALYCVDSAGIVRRLVESWGNQWMTVADLRRSESVEELNLGIFHFTVGISGGNWVGQILRVCSPIHLPIH